MAQPLPNSIMNQDVTNRLRFQLRVARGQMSAALAEQLSPGYADERGDSNQLVDTGSGETLPGGFSTDLFRDPNWSNELGGLVITPGIGNPAIPQRPGWRTVELPDPNAGMAGALASKSWLLLPPAELQPGEITAFDTGPEQAPMPPPGGPRPAPIPTPNAPPVPIPPPVPPQPPSPGPTPTPVPPPVPGPTPPGGGGGGGGSGGGALRQVLAEQQRVQQTARQPKPPGPLRQRREGSFVPVKKRYLKDT